MAVVETLALELRRQRDRGHDFDTAWDTALPMALATACDAADWLPTLVATREGWQCGYERRRLTREARALTAIAHDEDGPLEHRDINARTCADCGGPIPSKRGRRGPARYCTDTCKRAANRRAPVAA